MFLLLFFKMEISVTILVIDLKNDTHQIFQLLKETEQEKCSFSDFAVWPQTFFYTRYIKIHLSNQYRSTGSH